MKDKTQKAIERLKQLHMDKVEKAFEKGEVDFSALITESCGGVYDLKTYPEWGWQIRLFEKENNALVYHAVHQKTSKEELLSLLYVSDETELFELNSDMEATADVFMVNIRQPELSDFATIGVRRACDGLIRTF